MDAARQDKDRSSMEGSSVNDSSNMDEVVISSPDSGLNEAKPRILPQVLATLASCVACITAGCILGYSSPTLPALQHYGYLDDMQASWYGSVVALAAIVGGPLAGVMMERFGRKTTIMLSCVPALIGWCMLAYFRTAATLCLGRAFTGISLGMNFASVPLYVVEVTSKHLRGLLGSGSQLGITLGLLYVYSAGAVLQWQWLAVSVIVFLAINVTTMVWMPESPRWLYKRGRKDEAMRALNWLGGSQTEMEEIQAGVDDQEEGFTLKDMKKRSIYMPFVLSVGVMFFSQASGINGIIFYLDTIFQDSGFKHQANLPSILIAVVQVVVTAISCVLIDRMGRKVLLIMSGSILTISCTTLGVYYYLVNVHHVDGLSWLSLTSLIVYNIGFSIGYGPIPFLYVSEVFPKKVRGPFTGFLTGFNLFVAFIISKEFSDIERLLEAYGAFWLFAGINFVGVVLTVLFLPETKGRSLEEIEARFEAPTGNYEHMPDTHA